MIDVWGVASNSLWIAGLAIVLATFSRAHWLAGREKVKFRAALNRTAIQRTVDLGWFIFCAGLAATSRTLWERIVWGLLAVTWAVQACLAGKRRLSQ